MKLRYPSYKIYINGNDDVLHPEMFSKNVKDYLINKIETIPTFEKYIEFNKPSLIIFIR